MYIYCIDICWAYGDEGANPYESKSERKHSGKLGTKAKGIQPLLCIFIYIYKGSMIWVTLKRILSMAAVAYHSPEVC